MFFGKQEPLKVYSYSPEEMAAFAYALIKTSKGDIWVKLFADEVPGTVANFATLAKEGFYNGLKFHRVIKGFMAQGGCPHSAPGGNVARIGTGGPGWRIACETQKNIHRHVRGSLSMAHAGRDTGGSQFFICFVPCSHLDGQHTVFGQIEENDATSFGVLDAIVQNDIIEAIEIHKTRK